LLTQCPNMIGALLKTNFLKRHHYLPDSAPDLADPEIESTSCELSYNTTLYPPYIYILYLLTILVCPYSVPDPLLILHLIPRLILHLMVVV